MQIASAMTWSKLSPSDQAIIKQAAQESAEIERALWAEKEKASEEKVKKSGVVVTYLSQEEKQKFQDAMEPLYKKYGEGNQAIITRIQETK
jgi:TRAP-type C4-dicarboxylate transport system substrate-binding protein